MDKCSKLISKTGEEKVVEKQKRKSKSGDRKCSYSLSNESANKKLLESQSILHEKNKQLQDIVKKLTVEVEELKTNSKESNMIDFSKDELKIKTKSRFKERSTPVKTSMTDIGSERTSKNSLYSAIDELDIILSKIKNESKKIEIKPGPEEITDNIKALTKQLETEQHKSESIMETLRRERYDDEKGNLKGKLMDMKDKMTNLEVDNTKLRFQVEQLTDDLCRMKREMERTEDELKIELKRNRDMEDEKDTLKDKLSNVENDNLRLKKEMIEELNEANRAKRISIDMEIALQHVSEAYENKRQETMKYIDQLDEANKTIKMYKEKLGIN